MSSVPSTITFDSLANSGMPPAQKSAIRRWYESSQGPGGGGKLALAKLHAKSAGEGLRAGGESLLVGGILGAIHAKRAAGLDFPIGKPDATGRSQTLPADAIAGVVGLIAGTMMAQEEVGKDLQNAGAAALTVYAFRKTNDLLVEAQIKAAGGSISPTGEVLTAAGAHNHNLGTLISKVDKKGVAFAGDHSVFGRDGRGGGGGAWQAASYPGGHGSSDMGEDPIVRAARALG